MSEKQYTLAYVSLNDLSRIVSELAANYSELDDPTIDHKLVLQLWPKGHVDYSHGVVDESTDKPCLTIRVCETDSEMSYIPADSVERGLVLLSDDGEEVQDDYSE